MALNIRDCVPPLGRGSSVVGAQLLNLGKFVYPTLPVSFGSDTKSRWSRASIWCLHEGSKRSHTGGNNGLFGV